MTVTSASSHVLVTSPFLGRFFRGPMVATNHPDHSPIGATGATRPLGKLVVGKVADAHLPKANQFVDL